MDEQKIIEAFHLMWDHFPEPVLLIKKNRQIYAANRKAVSFGMDKQVRCSDRGNPEQHKGCLCNRAIDEKRRPASFTTARLAKPMDIGCL